MRKSLAWTLGGTVVLSGIALWLPKDDGAMNVMPARAWAGSQDLTTSSGQQRVSLPLQATRAEAPLPSNWPAVSLSPAKRDLFAPVLPPAPPVPKAPQVALAPAPSAEPPAPMPPPMNYRYFGQMRGPDGSLLVFLGRDNTPIQVAVGDRLDDGYVVESITEEGIHLVYPPLGVKALVNIPPTPR